MPADLVKVEPSSPQRREKEPLHLHYQGDAPPDLREYWQVLRRRKWIILVTLAVLVLAALVYNHLATPLYRSTVKIQINPEKFILLSSDQVQESSEDLDYLQTQHEVLRSQTLARRVARRLAPQDDAPQELETAGRLLQGLKVEPIQGTRLVLIHYQSEQPEMAAKVANLWAEEFLEYHFETRYQSTMRSTEFLRRELAELKKAVEKSEAELIQYGQAHNILVLQEGQGPFLQKLEQLNREATQVETELITTQARYQTLRTASLEQFPQSLKSSVITALEDRLLQLEQSLTSLRSKFGNNWPDVKTLREQIEQVQKQLEAEKGAALQEALQQAKMDYEAALARHRLLLNSLNRQKEEVGRLSEASVQYNILKREVETNKQLYDGLLQRLKEAGVTAGMKAENIHVVDPAQVPDSLYSPQKGRNLLLAVVLGTLLGVGLAFLVDWSDNTLKNGEEMEKLIGIPLLGSLPLTHKLLSAQGKEKGKTPPARRQPQGEAQWPEGEGIIPADNPWSPAWEPYRSVVASILLSHSDQPPQKILFTSSVSGEGKTTVLINTAIVLAETGARTLLLDMDLRKPTLASLFQVSETPGMSLFLSGNTSLVLDVVETAVPNLFLFPAGPQPPNPPELLHSERLRMVLSLLADQFDYILMDSPPVLAVTDSLLLSSYSDGVILVSRAGRVPRNLAQEARNRLLEVGAKILGGIINGVNPSQSGYSGYPVYEQAYFRSGSQELDSAQDVLGGMEL